MKKTILAVVTSSLLAASANAAVVYDKDGQQVDVTGRIQYQVFVDGITNVKIKY
jgi:predicted porin